jgi:uncharacterized protein (TIGR03435 family)
VAVLVCWPLCAQERFSSREFEAAVVNPSDPTPAVSALIPANAKLMGNHVTLMRLISFAYDLSYGQISGPSWLDSSQFDVIAKGQVGSTDIELRLMTQTLLAARFGLHFHFEKRTAKVYVLSLAGGPLKVVSANKPQPHRRVPPGRHSTLGGDFTMEGFARYLSRIMQAPILDRTGLTERYHYYLWWGLDPEIDPDMFQALKEQLGLMLRADKSDVEFLVIDRINRMPSEN